MLRNMSKNSYNPDFVSAPGETLVETIEQLGISQSELARRIGRPVKTINEIAQGKAAITPETALQLERALGISAEFWNAREAHYRASLATQAETHRLSTQLAWLKQVPVRAMIKLGWINDEENKIDVLRNVLNFFGIAAIEQFDNVFLQPQVRFRKANSFESDQVALAAWLRKGEIEAQSIVCASYTEDHFRLVLQSVRELTRLNDFNEAIETLQECCAEAGVAVVIVPELPGARVSGATRWLSPHRAIIQLSFRYKRDDQFWFSFFHEAGHILLHGKRDVFIEGTEHKGPEEEEANQFAEDQLLPRNVYTSWIETTDYAYPYHGIEKFAKAQGISASIVAGRLQHDGKLQQSAANQFRRVIEIT